jgi:hypothetical protein
LTAEADRIPAVEIYKGCRIHDQQPKSRIETVVKPEIDRVFAIFDPQRLFSICGNVSWAPEARLLCRARLLAGWELATEGRMPRPEGITIESVKARTGGLDDTTWRDNHHYCSRLDYPKWCMPLQYREGVPQPAEREVPIPYRYHFE